MARWGARSSIGEQSRPVDGARKVPPRSPLGSSRPNGAGSLPEVSRPSPTVSDDSPVPFSPVTLSPAAATSPVAPGLLADTGLLADPAILDAQWADNGPGWVAVPGPTSGGISSPTAGADRCRSRPRRDAPGLCRRSSAGRLLAGRRLAERRSAAGRLIPSFRAFSGGFSSAAGGLWVGFSPAAVAVDSPAFGGGLPAHCQPSWPQWHQPPSPVRRPPPLEALAPGGPAAEGTAARAGSNNTLLVSAAEGAQARLARRTSRSLWRCGASGARIHGLRVFGCMLAPNPTGGQA